MAYKPFRKSKRAYKPRRKMAKKPSKKMTFASRVKKVIHSQIENKKTGTYAANTLVNYCGSVTMPTIINLCPVPTQGSTVQQRVGNQIRVMKATINGFCVIKPYSATLNTLTSPTLVKMWLCRRKSYNVAMGGLPASSDWAQFFQNGSTTLGFQSSILDMVLRNNTEYWTILATKQITLSAAIGSMGTTDSGECLKRFSFSFAKHLGTLLYNDVATQPTNKELFLAFQNVNADGSSSVVAQELSEISYTVEWEYEDA